MKRGFTLMEVLVALALFSVVVTISTNLFLSFQRTSRKTEALEQLTASARFIVERVAREVREGTVDYTKYSIPMLGPQTALHLKTATDQELRFEFVNNTIAMDDEALTGAQVRVAAAQFTIAPTKDPFAFNEDNGEFEDNAQPRVTIFLSLDNNKPETDRDYTKYDVQTTISSRVYRR